MINRKLSVLLGASGPREESTSDYKKEMRFSKRDLQVLQLEAMDPEREAILRKLCC